MQSVNRRQLWDKLTIDSLPIYSEQQRKKSGESNKGRVSSEKSEFSGKKKDT